MTKPIILDANLALLLVVGLTNRSYIAIHKRLQGYDAIDFDILLEIISGTSDVVLTPNVLTETSNLIRYVKEPIRSEVSVILADLISKGNELFIASREAAARAEYVRLGLTDAVLLEIASRDAILLTIDLDLYLAALNANLSAQNFNHIKEARPDFQ